jgi:hypothetical protein
VWTVAGESTLVYYDLKAGTPEHAAAREAQVQGWSEVARSLRATDPFHRLLTVHPGPESGRFQPIADMSQLDFIFLQPGHADWETLPLALEHQARARREFPRQPSLMGEVCFEGMHGGGSGPKIQRYLFWSTVLSGAPGFSYGTDTTWQFNRRGEPFGPSPHGMAWGNTPWEEGYRWAGSEHVGLGRKILATLEWWRMEPHPEWLTVAATPKDVMKPFCAGIPGRLRVVYLPKGQPRWGQPFKVRGLETGLRYTARYIDPITGRVEPSVEVTSVNGEWPLPYPPHTPGLGADLGGNVILFPAAADRIGSTSGKIQTRKRLAASYNSITERPHALILVAACHGVRVELVRPIEPCRMAGSVIPEGDGPGARVSLVIEQRD